MVTLTKKNINQKKTFIIDKKQTHTQTAMEKNALDYSRATQA
jgi:hypothetical protein